jgi:hypothetical protein
MAERFPNISQAATIQWPPAGSGPAAAHSLARAIFKTGINRVPNKGFYFFFFSLFCSS